MPPSMRASVAIRERAPSRTVAGYSLLAQSLLLLVTFLWASVVDERFFAGDAAIYYSMLRDGSWSDAYSLEPTLFLLVRLCSPKTFSAYIFCSGAIALTVLLYAFYRLGYSGTEQVLLILFFSCSYYGVHFLLDFQRQFYAVVFFVLAVSSKKPAPLAWAASLLSHAYSFSLLLFWTARRLPLKAALLAIALATPVIYSLALALGYEQKLLQYAAVGDSETQLMIKQPMNLLFAAIVLATTRKGSNDVRTLSWLFIALSLPTLVWPAYSGLFVRFDYYFFPALIALWPSRLNPDRRLIFAATMIGSTVLGFFLWIRMNLGDFFSAVDPFTR